MCGIFTALYLPAQNGNSESWEWGQKYSKMIQDSGYRSADICLVMQAVGQAVHSLSMWSLRSQWLYHQPLRPPKQWHNCYRKLPSGKCNVSKEVFSFFLTLNVLSCLEKMSLGGRKKKKLPSNDQWNNCSPLLAARLPVSWHSLLKQFVLQLAIVCFC